MKYLHRLLAATSVAFFIAGSALAQNAGTVTNHAFVIGKGAGTAGYTSLLCGSAQLAVGQSAADPICRTITGDVTITAAGATAIGATKVTSAMLNADVFSTAHSWAGQQTFVAPILGTPASGVATNLTGLPISTGLTGAGTGVLTALGVNVGTAGSFVVNGGALGTPSSGTLTSATGLPISTGLTGAGTGVLTALGVNVGSAGAFVTFNGALGTPSSGTGTNLTGIPTSGLTGTLQAAQFPALTGDVTTSAGALATTIAANAVTNAKAAQMAAYTIKGNSTGSTANAGDISIPALTQKVSPAGADYVMIADSAASNALKYALVSSLASAGSVSSIAGNTGAFTLSTGITNSTNDIRLDKATAANLEAGTSNKALTADNIFDAEVTITFAASQTLDFNTFLNARITATANTTSLTCSNIKASQSGVITWVQDATGSRTMVAGWCSQFRWAGGTRGVLSTAVNAIDALFYQCISTSICYVSLGKAQAN